MVWIKTLLSGQNRASLSVKEGNINNGYYTLKLE